MLRNRRRLVMAVVSVVLAAAVVLGVYLFHLFEAGVQRRRAQSQATIAAQAQQHHATELRLCEVAINGQDAKLRALIGALGDAAAAPRSPAEAQARAENRSIIDRFLGPIDCEKFVATGIQVPRP